jgi:hypothetical protein
MTTNHKSLLRLALAICVELAAHSGKRRLVDLPDTSWETCARAVRQMRRAELRGWHLAAADLSTDLRHYLTSLESQVASILRELPSSSMVETLATTSDIYKDLIALGKEFDEINYDRHAKWLSVTTEPLELEGVYLGPFEIRLNWRRDALTYRVIASDPHPPESRENVTHPHVMDDVLCEGDGKPAIREALAQGRMLDFFTLVASVLRTYNPESPFVELALWEGQSCSDCGAFVSDDYYICARCSSTLCSGCEVSCASCEESYCSQCVTGCSACDQCYCGNCMGRCIECNSRLCAACLSEEERCQKCYEKEQFQESDQSATMSGQSEV